MSFIIHSLFSTSLHKSIRRRNFITFLLKTAHYSITPSRLGSSGVSRFTPDEVTEILRGNEFTSGEDFKEPLSSGPILSFDMNSLASNDPMEDSHAEAILKNGRNSMLFGVIDGHGGAACSQVVAKRLLHYVAASLLPTPELTSHLSAVESQDVNSPHFHLLQTFNDPYELVKDLQILYTASYTEYLRQILRDSVERLENDEGVSVGECLTKAFEYLDDDMSSEASSSDMKTLTVAMSGAVATVAHFDGPHLHVASSGDCTAVLGSLGDNETWIAKKMTTEHNTENQEEVKRILSQHPESEHRDIFKKDRLLGILAPLRAFGDFKFKWPKNKILQLLSPVLGLDAVLPSYKTPPYLTARPDVINHRLTARDKFLVIASDGLWDLMTPMQVIRLIGEHTGGKITLSPLELNEEYSSIKLKEIHELLRVRQVALKIKPDDSNAATHLLRCALGGTAYGVDHGRLSNMLSIPKDMVRMFRDDITVTVIFFDSDFLRHV